MGFPCQGFSLLGVVREDISRNGMTGPSKFSRIIGALVELVVIIRCLCLLRLKLSGGRLGCGYAFPACILFRVLMGCIVLWGKCYCINTIFHYLSSGLLPLHVSWDPRYPCQIRAHISEPSRHCDNFQLLFAQWLVVVIVCQ